MKLIILIFVGAVLAASQIAPDYTPLQCSLHGGKLCSNNYLTTCVSAGSPCPAGSFAIPSPDRISCEGVPPYGACENSICGANCQCEQTVNAFVKCYEPASSYSYPFVVFGYNNTGLSAVTISIDACYNGINNGDVYQGQPSTFLPGLHEYAVAIPAVNYPLCWRLGDQQVCFDSNQPGDIPMCSDIACGHADCFSCTTDESLICNWCGAPDSENPATNGICFPSASFPETVCELGTSSAEVCPVLVTEGAECSFYTSCNTCSADSSCGWCHSTCSCKSLEFIESSCPESGVPGVVITEPEQCTSEVSSCSNVDPQAAFDAFFIATNGQQWTNKNGWNTPGTSYCQYYGVNCAAGTIDLSSNNLRGVIPPEFFCALSTFNTVYLQNNNLEGVLPATIGNLNSIKFLDLHGNYLTGSLPSTIDQLSDSIQYLYLQDNCLSCSIPAELGNWLFLKELHLEGNAFVGDVPATFYTPEENDLRQLFEVHFECNNLNETPENVIAIETIRALINARFGGKYQAGPEDVPYLDLTGTNNICEWLHPKKCQAIV